MLFHSSEYAIFLVVVFVLFWLMSKMRMMRLFLLLVASYLFYATWSSQYLILIIVSSVIDYFLGLGMGSARSQGKRKLLLMLSLVANLGILAVFKYCDFFLESIEAAAAPWAVWDLGRLGLVLPVGISFYTFQTMSYTIDIYRGELKPCKNPLKFFVYVSFFPQLVAGPIVRAVDFLPQLDKDPEIKEGDAARGASLIMGGLIKKIVIGDFLAVNLVDRVFASPEMYSSVEVLSGVYGYAMQIYCDFSGYTDIAIGSALLLGFQLPLNFNRPYQADSLQDFWRRWHISLSSWLRDYLYISLGGNRKGPGKTYRNLIITMLLGGLWHGAAWTFVIWGALHGFTLMFTRLWQRWRKKRGLNFERWFWYKPLMVVLTFHFVCLTWIFFRADNLDQVWSVLSRLADFEWGTTNLTHTLLLALGGSYAVHQTPVAWREAAVETFKKIPVPLQALILVGIVLLLQKAMETQVVPFIYFQF